MVNRAKAKGTRFEGDAVSWLRSLGYRAVRRVLHGSKDEGDIGAVINGVPVTIECKDRKRVEALRWCEEAEAENANSGDAVWMVLWHRPGVGFRRFGRNLIIIEAEGLVRLVDGTDGEDR